MTEQELIDTINALIDADWQAGTPALIPEDIAWRAIDRCGDGAFTTEAVTDLVLQILTARCEPWKISPGTRPRLRAWKDGVVPLAPKPSVMEMLEAGRQAGESIAVTVARVRSAYPKLTEAAMQAEIEAYGGVWGLAWGVRGRGGGEFTRAEARGRGTRDPAMKAPNTLEPSSSASPSPPSTPAAPRCWRCE